MRKNNWKTNVKKVFYKLTLIKDDRCGNPEFVSRFAMNYTFTSYLSSLENSLNFIFMLILNPKKTYFEWI